MSDMTARFIKAAQENGGKLGEAAIVSLMAEAWDECEAAPYEIRLDPVRNVWEPVKDNPYRAAA